MQGSDSKEQEEIQSVMNGRKPVPDNPFFGCFESYVFPIIGYYVIFLFLKVNLLKFPRNKAHLSVLLKLCIIVFYLYTFFTV